MQRVAIIGAGAIGAGFLYPALYQSFDVHLYDLAAGRERFEISKLGIPWPFKISIELCSTKRLEGRAYDYVFIAVGCSNFLNVVPLLPLLAPTTVICCDNMMDPAQYAKDRIGGCGHIFVNGFPWVSCFSTGERQYLCEDGYLSVPEEVYNAGLKDCPVIRPYTSSFLEHDTRVLVHCGPHAVAAYNGWADGCTTIPEALRVRDYEPLWDALHKILPDDGGLVDRERERFEDERFPDPVLRVGRNPHRKLMAGERLPRLYSALQFASDEAKQLVRDGILNAVRFGRLYDPVVMMWRQQHGEGAFIQQYCGLGELGYGGSESV